MDEPVAGRLDFGCNCFSSGEPLNIESIMARAWLGMLNWLNMMHEDQNIEEAALIIGDAADAIVESMAEENGQWPVREEE